MKLAACYTVFDGVELLEKSILSMVGHVDFIVICWQQISNTGNESKLKLARELDKYLNHSDIYLIRYNTDLKLGPKENERRKHTRMIEEARDLGATHFIMAATDHFYNADEFEFAKRFCEVGDYDATFTSLYTYYKFPEWRLDPIENYFVPFICKLYQDTAIVQQSYRNFPLYVDPSVQTNTWKKWYLFKEFEIMLHHYSMIRLDIREKFENAASSWARGKVDEFTREWMEAEIEKPIELKYYPGKKLINVRDQFGLNSIFARESSAKGVK